MDGKAKEDLQRWKGMRITEGDEHSTKNYGLSPDTSE